MPDRVSYEDGFKSTAQPTDPVPRQSSGCLQDDLVAALITTHQETQSFFIEGQLPHILTEERIRQELAIHFDDLLNEDTIAEYAKRICPDTVVPDARFDSGDQIKTNSYIKILAILIMMENPTAILKILQDPEGVDDSDLPLIKSPRPKDERLYDLRLKRDPKKVLNCFPRKWNQLNIRNFEEWQWMFLPHVFVNSTGHKEVRHDVLEKSRILPFIRDRYASSKIELEGGFARVSKVVIHPKHHNFFTPPGKSDPAYFAVKSLHSSSREAFKREVEMLNKFSSNKHDHLVSLLATYEQFDRFFLLFDWAEADLQRYWRSVNPSPSFDTDTVLWMSRQCKGIAHGITMIHAHKTTCVKAGLAGDQNVIFGHHGDIKPENILWYTQQGQNASKVTGTLKLSDFGISEFSLHEKTLSMTRKTNLGMSLGYRAPESDLNESRAATGRSYDIWTLGCLYLEFITWMLGGSQLLDEFVRGRKTSDAMLHGIKTDSFFVLRLDKNGEKTAVIKPQVKMASLLCPSRVSGNWLT